jgi:magnesium transporter
MDIRFITGSQVKSATAADVPALLASDDGFVWIDIPSVDDDATALLTDVLSFHPLAVRDCVERNRLTKLHAYADHVFIVLHTPEHGRGGHVHYIELDQFIGSRFLVTVHGPLNPAVDPAVAVRQTEAVLARIEAGRLRPTSPVALSYAIVSAMARDMEGFIDRVTVDVWRLEQQVTGGHRGDPEVFLEELFNARHGLIVARTMAAMSAEIYGRMQTLDRYIPPGGRPFVADVADQFTRVRGLAEGERDYLQGVIDFYRTRTETKMTIAAERLAVIAVVTLPITALASIYGMNLIVHERSQWPHLAVVLLVMVAMSALLLMWARRHGWW